MKRYLWCLSVLLIYVQPLLAQVPANDDCANSRFLYLDPSGNLCISDSNTFATGDGTSNTCDAAAITPLPAGGNEVWYSYVVTGTVNTITVNQGGFNPAGKLSVTVLSGNCASPGSVNVCNTAPTSTDPASVAFTATPGTQLWFYVTSLESNGEFLICINSSNGFINPALSCNNASPLCNTYNFTSPGSGQPGSAPVPSCFNSPPVRPFWYKFTAGYNGPLEFTGIPSGFGGFRWALYDISAGCPGTEIACNTIYDPVLPFGMSSVVANCNSNPLCPPVTVTAGNTYALLLDDTTQSNSGFDFFWGANVVLMPTARFYVDSLEACGSFTANFSDSSTCNASTNWTFNYGDGSALITGTGPAIIIPPHFYGPGTYLARLTLLQAGGCSNTFSRQIIVKPAPSTNFSILDDSLCFDGILAATTDFTATNPVPSTVYNWIFPNNSSILITGTGQATASWNTSGIIPVGLQITENGCTSDTISDTLYIFDTPVSTFSLPDSACTGYDITVTYTGNSGPSAVYTWSYGGGNVSNPTNTQFSIQWNSPGSYTLSLTVNENGCTSTTHVDSLRVFGTPQISIQSPVIVCEDVATTVSPLATGAPAGSVFTWDFGTAILSGGNPTDGSSGIFTWPTSGNTYMTAIALSPEGCLSEKDSISITVQPKPDAAFNISDSVICGADSVLLTYTGTAPVSGNTFTWDFGTANLLNGGTANQWGPFYIAFPAPGAYPLSLILNDNVCNSDTIRDTVIAGNFPVSNAGSDLVICSKDQVAIGTTPVAGYSYNWSPSVFLNNASLSSPLASVNHNGTTDTVVQFIVTTTLGFCSLNDTMELQVKAVQQAFFIPPDPQCEAGNSFDFSPYYGIVPGSQQLWVINTDTIQSGQVLQYHFSNSGIQNISLLTQTPGCPSASYSTSVYVKENPEVEFETDIISGCAPLQIAFNDLNPALPGASYLWNFGDGIVSFQQNPVHTYTADGNYLPTMTIITADTCTATDTLNTLLSVFPAANAAFSAQPLVASNLNPLFNFYTLSGNTSCYYDFGDGSGDSSCNTTHLYSDTGTYIVTLYTNSTGGCADTFSLTVQVRPNFSLYIPSAFSPNNDQLNDIFRIYAEGIRQFEIQIYNRRGQVVFRSDETTSDWNGKYENEGEDCPAGVYVYEARARDFNNKNYNFRGRITIIR